MRLLQAGSTTLKFSGSTGALACLVAIATSSFHATVPPVASTTQTRRARREMWQS